MLNIGATELVVILLVALLVMGPKKLPDLSRTIGKVLAEFKRISTDVHNAVNQELRPLEKKEKRPADDLTAQVSQEPDQTPHNQVDAVVGAKSASTAKPDDPS